MLTSMVEFRLVAAMTPAVTPIRIASSRLMKASVAVNGTRVNISWITGAPVRIDMPRSAWDRRPRKLRYCCQNGRVRPSWWRMRSTSAAVASGPAITTAGSPGSSRLSRKTTVATPSSVGIATSSRRITYVITPRLPRRYPSLRRRCPGGHELLVRQADHVGHFGRRHEREPLVVQEDPGRLLPYRLGRVAVVLLTLGGVGPRVGLLDQRVDLWVLVVRSLEPGRWDACGVELLELLLRVQVRRCPAQQREVDPGLRRWHVHVCAEIRRPVSGRRPLHVQPGVAQVAGHRLSDLKVLHVAAGRRNHFDRHPCRARRLKHRLRLGGVVVVGAANRAVAEQGLR